MKRARFILLGVIFLGSLVFASCGSRHHKDGKEKVKRECCEMKKDTLGKKCCEMKKDSLEMKECCKKKECCDKKDGIEKKECCMKKKECRKMKEGKDCEMKCEKDKATCDTTKTKK